MCVFRATSCQCSIWIVVFVVSYLRCENNAFTNKYPKRIERIDDMSCYRVHRCEVPGCDNPDPSNRTYKPEWLQFTTPNKQESEQPLKCKRYSRTPSPAGNATECVASEFNPNDVEWCYDNWVFEERVNTVGTEVRVCRINSTIFTPQYSTGAYLEFYFRGGGMAVELKYFTRILKRANSKPVKFRTAKTWRNFR